MRIVFVVRYNDERDFELALERAGRAGDEAEDFAERLLILAVKRADAAVERIERALFRKTLASFDAEIEPIVLLAKSCFDVLPLQGETVMLSLSGEPNCARFGGAIGSLSGEVVFMARCSGGRAVSKRATRPATGAGETFSPLQPVAHARRRSNFFYEAADAFTGREAQARGGR